MSDLPHEDAEVEDDEEVWFEAEQLAEVSRVELGARADAGILRRGPSLDALSRVRAGPGLSLASLPGWPEASAAGQGIGEALAELVGELRPGDVVAVTGGERGVGRSSLLAQLGDGLALCEGAAMQTPVICVVEGSAELWRARSFARWSGLDARVLLDASAGARVPDLDEQLARFAASSWATLLGRQRFVDAAALRDEAARRELLASLRRWREQLQAAQDLAGSGDGVWPVLVVDPLEQLGDDRLGLLAELEGLARLEGLIVLLSCDAPAEADTRRFDRRVAVRLHATAPAHDALELELCHRRLGPRGRVRLSWDRGSGRITGGGAILA